MIAKGIQKWPAIVENNIPEAHPTPSHAALDLELSISPSNRMKPEFHISVTLFCAIFDGPYMEIMPDDYFSKKLFEMSYCVNYRFDDPLKEEATIQYIHAIMITTITEFNAELSRLNSNLTKHLDDSRECIQYPIPLLTTNRDLILKIWRLGSNSN